jgi:hypothetical protein
VGGITDPVLKNTKSKRIWGVAQPGKHKALSSSPNSRDIERETETHTERERDRERERQAF